MKRVGNLYRQIISIENLELADVAAQKGKSKQKGVIEHNQRREQDILDLHSSLKDKRYRTSKYHKFILFEPKRREIFVLPYYPNRILHHAILRVIESILTKCLIAQTYSCIKGRGIHRCLRDVKAALKNKEATKYCLKLDIQKFYPSINLDILKSKLRTKFKDNDLLDLLDEIIDSGEGGKSNLGVPIGNYLSQHFANFYLNSFDHWLKEEKKATVFRYCDDICVLGSDKAALHQLRKEIQEYLNTIGLTLSKYQVFAVNSRGIDFVGYVIYHDYVKIRKSIKLRFKKMLRRNKNYKSIASYNGWFTHANCKNLVKKFL